MSLSGARRFLTNLQQRLMPKSPADIEAERAAFQARMEHELATGRITGPVRRALERATGGLPGSKARYYFDTPHHKLEVRRGATVERERAASDIPPRAMAVALQSAKAARKRAARKAKRERRAQAVA